MSKYLEMETTNLLTDRLSSMGIDFFETIITKFKCFASFRHLRARNNVFSFSSYCTIQFLMSYKLRRSINNPNPFFKNPLNIGKVIIFRITRQSRKVDFNSISTHITWKSIIALTPLNLDFCSDNVLIMHFSSFKWIFHIYDNCWIVQCNDRDLQHFYHIFLYKRNGSQSYKIYLV